MSKFNEILNSSDASDALLGEQIDKKVDKGITLITHTFTSTAASTLELTPVNIEVPPNTFCIFNVSNQYSNSITERTVVSTSKETSGVTSAWNMIADSKDFCYGMFYNHGDTPKTLYVWSQHAKANANIIMLSYKFI